MFVQLTWRALRVVIVGCWGLAAMVTWHTMCCHESPPFAARPTCRYLPPPAATRAQCTAAIGTHCPVLVRRPRIHLHSPTPTFVRVRRPSFVSASCI